MTKYKVNVGAGVWCFILATLSSMAGNTPLTIYCIIIAILNIAYGVFRLTENYVYNKHMEQFRAKRKEKWDTWEKEHAHDFDCLDELEEKEIKRVA